MAATDDDHIETGEGKSTRTWCLFGKAEFGKPRQVVEASAGE